MKPYYQDKYATIYHGDCLELLPEMPKVDLVLTDPPYGAKQAEWDNEKPLEAVWNLIFDVLVDGGVLYYWGFWQCADWVLSNGKRVGLSPQSRIVWWFRTGVPQKKAFREDAENCWYFSKGEPNTFNFENYNEPYEDENNYKRYGRTGKHVGTVWQHERIFHNHPENCGHETQKPIELFEKIVGLSSNVDDLILDPFGGSCTTAVAAKQLNRKCIVIEIEEKYCEIGAKRLSQEVLDLESSTT